MGNLSTNAVIPRVNNRDVVVGTINRQDLPTVPANFRVAHVFVLNSSGELLLQQIAPGQRSSGLWGSSAAGYVLAGETYHQAARRTLKSEIGVSEATVGRVGKTSMPDLNGTKFISLFRARSDGPFHVDRNQVATVQFFPIQSLVVRLRDEPAAFTPTFRHLFAYYRRRA